MRKVAKPHLASRLCISKRSVFKVRHPDAPIGCPIAIAPPFTFTISGFQPISLFTAQARAANTSFASAKSRLFVDQLAFAKALRLAKIGPTPMIEGSRPAVA